MKLTREEMEAVLPAFLAWWENIPPPIRPDKGWVWEAFLAGVRAERDLPKPSLPASTFLR